MKLGLFSTVVTAFIGAEQDEITEAGLLAHLLHLCIRGEINVFLSSKTLHRVDIYATATKQSVLFLILILKLNLQHHFLATADIYITKINHQP